jgi:hypothetical protein
MRRLGIVVLAWGVCLASTGSVAAWSPATRVRIADEAVRFMPPSLRLALERQRDEVLRGMLDPMTDEDGPAHRPAAEGGSLETRIAAAAEAVVAAASRPRSFRAVARALGALAHAVSDAGFPPGAGGGDGARRYAHFAAFCESRAPRFPLVFYGHDAALPASGDFAAFAAAVLDEARAADAELARAYSAAGDPPSAAAFDDRSVPFAVGSLAYSKTITHVVRAWLTVWGRAGGDLARTPYLDSAATYRR